MHIVDSFYFGTNVIEDGCFQILRCYSKIQGQQVSRYRIVIIIFFLPIKEFLLKRCTDQFDRLYLEGASNARIMAISVHPYITGVPHRIKYLEALLDYVIGHDGVALMTASEIGDWYRAEMARK